MWYSNQFSSLKSVSVSGASVSVLDSVEIVGVTLDKHLTFDRHVTNLCQESNFHIRALRHIRPTLDRANANMLANSIVNSRLDYCNSILSGTSNYNLQRLQRVQNNLAWAVCIAPRRSSASDLLKQYTDFLDVVVSIISLRASHTKHWTNNN